MNVDETKAIHGMCMSCDPRVQPMDSRGLAERIWSRILADVPFEEAAEIVTSLYSRERRIVLQPGTIVEAWEEVRAEREKTLRALDSAERYLARFADEDPPEVTAKKREQRDRLLASLPERVRAARSLRALAGQERPQGGPEGAPPTYWTPSSF